MPVLHVIAGPSGAGKSTFARALQSQSIEFLNVDRGFKHLGWQYRYAQTVREAKNRIDYGDTFGIDDVFTAQAVEDMLVPACQAGHEIHARIIAAGDPGICMDRINKRVARGGHYHEPEIVLMRYRESMKTAGRIIRMSSKAYLFDNSDGDLKVLSEKAQGVISRKAGSIPEWAQKILDEAETLPAKNAAPIPAMAPKPAGNPGTRNDPGLSR